MNRTFSIQCDNPDICVAIEPKTAEDGIEVYRIRVTLPCKMTPPPVQITWLEDMVGLLHVWHPMASTHHAMHQWFGATQSRSCFHWGAPVLTTIGEGGINSRTVAISDPITPSSIRFWVDDLPQNNQVAYAVVLFDGICDDIETYETDLRIDARPQHFSAAVQEVYPWWCSYGWNIPQIPSAAEDALYSSWYNFHQAPDGERLLADLKIAAELGFKTVILDDGWQFPGPSCGDYRLCGEWQMSPDKFPDFKAFSDAVHALGMKLLVWFTVPFIGIDSPLFEEYRDKFLYVDRGLMNAGALDPRYPEVREYIKNTYRRFLVDYDIDGFKLDFIDAFLPPTETKPYDPVVMDCETTGQAVRLLLTEITSELAEIKPDLLYEYRQCYVGPAINQFGNMLRVGDCAYEAQLNRIGITDLRLLGYPVAVHADMLFWAPEESIRMCTRQLLNILFGVPQISVILADSTEEQKALLQAYLSYWTKNRELLLHGTFRAYFPEQCYTRITAENEQRIIAVHHSDLPYICDERDCDLHHNGDADGLIVENPTDTALTAEVSLLFGRQHLQTVAIPPHSIIRLPVPQTGMAHITKA